MKSSKGSAFERDICRKLSLWISGGKWDDLFWRTSGSGARATVRSKNSRRTIGQYGDVHATSKEGRWFTKLFTIELKRGYNRSSVQDLFDQNKKSLYKEFILQAAEQAKQACTPYWMLIVKRDRREPLVLIPYLFYDVMCNKEAYDECLIGCNSMDLCLANDKKQVDRIIIVRLNDWMKFISPAMTRFVYIRKKNL